MNEAPRITDVAAVSFRVVLIFAYAVSIAAVYSPSRAA